MPAVTGGLRSDLRSQPVLIESKDTSKRYRIQTECLRAMATSDLSDYEKQRLQNIARNNRVMGGLGLLSSSSQVHHCAQRKRRKQSLPKTIPVQPTRRSARNMGVTRPNYLEGGALYSDQGHSRWRAQRTESKHDRIGQPPQDDPPGKDLDDEEERQRKMRRKEGGRAIRQSTTVVRPEPDADASRAVRCDIPRVCREYLGRAMPGGRTKANVMAELSEKRTLPRFSKYSGVVEWQNCVVLWVNVGGSDYKNLFLDDGRRMTWFAGSKHHTGTPVIQRLLATACQSTAETGKGSGVRGGSDSVDKGVFLGEKDQILLMCRVQPGAYVYMGRVSYDSHDDTQSPMQFTWRLDDFDACTQRRLSQQASTAEGLDGQLKGLQTDGSSAKDGTGDVEDGEFGEDFLNFHAILEAASR
jgi:hypothetical protein